MSKHAVHYLKFKKHTLTIYLDQLFTVLVYTTFPADVRGRARLADFGISRRLPKGQTTLHTSSAGTRCWMAKETLAEDADIPYKRSTDIQVSFYV